MYWSIWLLSRYDHSSGLSSAQLQGLFESTRQYYWETKRSWPSVFFSCPWIILFPRPLCQWNSGKMCHMAVSLRWLNIQWEVWDIILAQWSRMIKKKRPHNPLDDFPVMQWESPYSSRTCKNVFFYFWKDMIHNNLIKRGFFCLY